MGQPSSVVASTLKDHRDQAHLPERVQLCARTAFGHRLAALDEAKRYDFLLFTIVKYLEIVRFQVVNGMALLVADHHIQKDFLAGRPHCGTLLRGSWVLLGGPGGCKRQRDRCETDAHDFARMFHCSFPSLSGLTWIPFIRLHDSNTMIRELVVRARQLELWHMASYAFVRGHRARLGARLSTAVTGLEFCVVFYWLTAD